MPLKSYCAVIIACCIVAIPGFCGARSAGDGRLKEGSAVVLISKKDKENKKKEKQAKKEAGSGGGSTGIISGRNSDTMQPGTGSTGTKVEGKSVTP